MVGRRRLLACVGTALLAGCPSADEGTPTIGTPVGDVAVSSAFDHGGSIPERYTGDGADVSPPLAVGAVPSETATQALVVDDPDAPDPPFTHWLCWNVPPAVGEIPPAIPRERLVPALDGGAQGENDFGDVGYRGPLPPAEDGPHRYRFTVVALKTTLDLEPGADRAAVDGAIAGAVLDRGRLVGLYHR